MATMTMLYQNVDEFANTGWLWVLGHADEGYRCEGTVYGHTDAPCSNLAVWTCTSNEEMPYQEQFCGTHASEAMQHHTVLVSDEDTPSPVVLLYTRQGEELWWHPGSNDGNLDSGYAVLTDWDFQEDMPVLVLATEFAPTGK